MTVRKRGRGKKVPVQTKNRSCDGKKRHRTWAEAENHMWAKIRYGAARNAVNVYACTFGGQTHYHVGHTPGNLGKR